MAASRDSTILRVLILAATLTFAPQPVASLSWVADLQFTSDTDEATELPESFHVGLSASGSLSPTVLYPVPSGVTFGSGSAGTIFKTAVGEGGNIGGGGSDSGETTSFITITDTATTIEASAVVSLSTELILTGTQVFSAGSVIGSGIRDVISGDASTSAASSLFLGQVESATSVPFDDRLVSLPQFKQNSSFHSQSPSRIESDAGFPTTTFP
ncbi:hypothetical protein R3P38DRAFT_9162 [Favolaschia claudopus]|uniref:Uncharacterized protein n=1 Tax=Favolaschia claudopus TaxID=2862362 RepID=A0AAW0EDW6_9AGAR